MDLLSEGSNESRILTARHLSGKMNNAVHTALCYNYSIAPDVGSYVAVLGTYAWVIWFCAALVLGVICVLYAITLRSARQHWRICITNVAFIMAIYPVVAASSLVAIIVPRATVLCEALTQQVVMVALYHFFCMVLAECGGPDKLIRMSNDTHWKTRVPPCCCWPCCVIPQPTINARNLTRVRYTILQIPIVQGLLSFIILVLWAEDMSLYLKSVTFIQILGGVFITFGLWGVIMWVKTAESLGINLRARFTALQLVLLVVMLQYGVVKGVTDFIEMPCVLSLHPSIFVNLVQHSVIIVEMLVLCLCARRTYSAAPPLGKRSGLAERGDTFDIETL